MIAAAGMHWDRIDVGLIKRELDCSSRIEPAMAYATLNADEEKRVYVLEGVFDPRQESQWHLERSQAVGPRVPDTSHFTFEIRKSGDGTADVNGVAKVTVFHADL